MGSARCAECHRDVHDAWKGSHHARAMQPAREETVLGDFGDATFVHRGKTWRFYRDGARFMVRAEGPDGALEPHEVAWTFGVAPLQQYLVPFPGGRLQALSAAWDVGRRRWFHVDPGPPAPPGDWLHWTRPGQCWNAMCADCHSTALAKGYDPETDTYRTTAAEHGVGCEACHGPGSAHLAWAGRPAGERTGPVGAGLALATRGLPAARLVGLCAPCHSRRTQLADQGAPGGELLDRYLPVLLEPGLFHADGQILDEDFEWHPFTQSRMYAKGVGCLDCHDVHTGRRRAEGNALCLRCHEAGRFDAPGHHHHAGGRARPGSQCVACHMPGRDYMVVHFRRDHSLRIPRPDLTAATGVPNACAAAGCHAGRSAGWLQRRSEAWWGTPRRPSWAPALVAGRRRAAGSEAELARLAGARADAPAVVRATALDVLASLPGPEVGPALAAALADPEPLVRVVAARRLSPGGPVEAARALRPLLEDPARLVRAEAAARLAGPAGASLDERGRRALDLALVEHEAGQRYQADLPSGPFNLGNLEAARGRPLEAERQYRRALALDGRFVLATVNLATLLAGRGRLPEAERLLREAQAQRPRDAGISFALGLVLAEEGRAAEAERALRAAWTADPSHAPAAFNLAVLVGARAPAEAARLAGRAAALRPGEPRYGFTRGYFLARAGDLRGAAAALEGVLARHPGHADSVGLLAEVYARLGRAADAEALRRSASAGAP